MTIANGQTNLASYAYTLGAAGNRTQLVENTGRTVNYVYDDLYRLTSETIANSSNNGIVSYGYDAVGNRLNRNSSVALVPNQTSTFDANDRLSSDVYDANGSTKVSNGKTYDYDFENKLTSTSDGRMKGLCTCHLCHTNMTRTTGWFLPLFLAKQVNFLYYSLVMHTLKH